MTEPSPEIAALRAVVEAQSTLLRDVLTLLGKGIAAPGGPSPIAQARELIELAKELVPPAPLPAPGPAAGAGGSPWLAMADRLAAALERVWDRSNQGGEQPAAPGTKVTLMIPRWAAPLAPYIPHLVRMAQENGAPELQAQAVVGQLSAADLATLQPVFSGDDYPSNVLSTFPVLQPFAAWVTPFLFALRGAAQQPPSAPPAPPPAAGPGRRGRSAARG